MKILDTIKNGIFSMLSEKGEISSKRMIALGSAVVFLSAVLFSIWDLSRKLESAISEKYIGYLKFTQVALISLICLLLGVATFAQIIALKNGGNPPKEDEPTPQ